jgi:voltage-dependent potassium channel beta subunit
MQYRRLGRSGVKVSEVSIGGWLTHGRTISDDVTTSIVRRSFDLGINFFDTADVYHNGEAELSLGKAIQEFRRTDLFIATKCFFPMSDRPNDRGLSRKHIVESVEASLRRMRLDYIDLQQFHRFDPEVPLDEIVHAISDLIKQGKVLYWGVSEWPAHQISNLVATAKELLATLPASNQPQYNLLNRNIESAVIPVCEHHGIGQVVFSPLAQGVLTGKYLPGSPLPEGSRGADDKSNMFMRGYLSDDALLARIQKLKVFVEGLGQTLAEFSLAWCLRQPIVTSVITGASSVEQVEQNAKASGLTFAPEVYQAAEAILAGTDA